MAINGRNRWFRYRTLPAIDQENVSYSSVNTVGNLFALRERADCEQWSKQAQRRNYQLPRFAIAVIINFCIFMSFIKTNASFGRTFLGWR